VAAACIAALASGWLIREVRSFANPPTELVTQESARLTSLSSNNRWVWWNEAWEAFRGEPILGTGASSFPVVHRLLREDQLTVTTPHSAPVQLLAETGVIGAVLGISAAALALVALLRAVGRRSGLERAAAAALFAGIAAYAVHSLVDFPQDFVAVSAPALAATGVLLGGPSRGAPRRASLVWLAPAALLGAAAIVSLAGPWLAARRVSETYALLSAGQQEEALRAAESARGLNPLALDASFAEARAHAVLGDIEAARAVLVDAVRRHPLNSEAWTELGVLESTVPGREEVAARYLERARELDPRGRAAIG
jgi:tetratricopeptide (TPR) repeat protein